jgi:hypothetical protein
MEIVVHTALSSMKDCVVLVMTLFYLGKRILSMQTNTDEWQLDMVGLVVVAEKSLAFVHIRQDLVA